MRALPFDAYPRLRVTGLINGADHEGTFMPIGGNYCMMLSAKFVKRLGLTLGSDVHIAFEVADQDAVHMDPHIHDALNQNEELWEEWNALTTGKRRSWCVQVSKLKSIEAKHRNIEKLMAVLVDW